MGVSCICYCAVMMGTMPRAACVLGRELLKEPMADKPVMALHFRSAQAGEFLPKAYPGGGDSRENQTREAKVCNNGVSAERDLASGSSWQVPELIF